MARKGCTNFKCENIDLKKVRECPLLFNYVNSILNKSDINACRVKMLSLGWEDVTLES